MAAVCYDGKYEIMIRVEVPLVKKQNSVEDGQVHAPLDIGNYL